MVIIIEEKDRAKIETSGFMVIEFKRMIYKCWDALMSAWDTIKGIISPIIDTLVKIQGQMYEDGLKTWKGMTPKERYKFNEWCRKGKPPQLNYGADMTHHCRNNC